MKKFFSLVLALVMALSLTTVAWGAPTGTGTQAEPYVVGNEADFITAVANDNCYVKLSGQITITGSVSIDKTVTIDVAAVTATADAIKVTGTLTLGENVTISGAAYNTGGLIYVNGGTVNVNGATISATSGNGTVVYVDDSGALNVNGGSITSVDGKCIAVTGATATINDGTITSQNNSTAYIKENDGGTLNIAGGTVTTNATGKLAAVYAYDGTINVTGGTIKNTNSGNTSAALVGSEKGTGGPATVNVSDGNVQSVGVTDADATVTVTGGTFATAPAAAFVPAGKSVVPDAYGNYVLADTADVPTGSSSKPYFTTDFVNFKVSTYCDLTNYKYELRHFYNGSEAAKMFDKKVIVAIDEFGGLTYLYECVVATSKDSATLAFVNGRDITYLNTVNPNWVGKATLVKTVEFDDVEKCGDVFTKNDVAVYEDANGVLYVENKSGAPYNVDNGKQVLLVPAADVVVPVDVFEAPGYTYTNNVVYTIGHDYDYNLKSVNGKQSVTSVFCKDKDCGKTFKFLAGTEAEAIAKFKAGNYVDSGLKINTTTVVWVAKDGVSAGGSANLPVTLPTAPSTDKVTSAETFDAGIAMYVGMSVMAAAGSAVVIGKKKD